MFVGKLNGAASTVPWATTASEYFTEMVLLKPFVSSYYNII